MDDLTRQIDAHVRDGGVQAALDGLLGRTPPLVRVPGISSSDVDDYVARRYGQAVDNFATFRMLKRPQMRWGWWTEEVARELQQFYLDLIAGKRPKLALMAPPQHGKSWTVWDFIQWIAGKHPEWKTIFGSFSYGLGVACNRDLVRTIQSDVYKSIFPHMRIDDPGWTCTTEEVEFVGHAGSFRNTTVQRPINGFGLDFGVVDDPVKDREEANSKHQRDKTWDWFADSLFNRFSQNAGLIIIMTRWHVDDMLGRFLQKFADEVKVLRYPAIAEEETRHTYRGRTYVRRKGEPLFAEHKPLDFLLERKKMETQGSWESLFQQSPIIVGGGAIPIEKLQVLPHWGPGDRGKIVASCRYWDKAGTADNVDAAYTAGVLMHKLDDGRYLIEHIERGQWSALDREQRIAQVAANDAMTCPSLEIVVEQEPGSGGKESVEATIRNLAGFRVYADKVTGKKEVRAEPFVAQVQGGNVWLVAGAWVPPFWDECEPWPFGKFMDQVDAAAGAFNRLATATAYNTNYSQWAY